MKDRIQPVAKLGFFDGNASEDGCYKLAQNECTIQKRTKLSNKRKHLRKQRKAINEKADRQQEGLFPTFYDSPPFLSSSIA